MSEAPRLHILPFTATAATDVTQTGGKGAMLSRLYQAGLPIPPGCVLTPQAMTIYLEAQDLSAPIDQPTRERFQHESIPPTLQQELHTVLSQLGSADSAPNRWAVRSSAIAEDSATASFAGMYDSFLDIPDEGLWDAIRSCWLSWWSDRAQSYRQQLGHSDPIPAMAVVIQRLVPAQAAGIAFTADPISGDSSQMVINAAPGLGVDVVSGVVEPEHYTLRKIPPFDITEARFFQPDGPPLLDSGTITTLGTLLTRIEAICQQPQDVEWAWDGQQCWVVQSRPITTLPQAALGTSPDIWTNANLKDVLPGLVSPLAWTVIGPQLEFGIRKIYQQVGYTWPAERLVIRRFWGRLYFNVTIIQQAGYEAFGVMPTQTLEQLGGSTLSLWTPEHPLTWRQRLRQVGNLLRIVGALNKLRQRAPAELANIRQQWAEELPTIPQLDRDAVLQAITSRAEPDQASLNLHLSLSSGMDGNFSFLRRLIQRHLPHTSGGLFAELVMGLGEVTSADQSYDLWALSRQARTQPEIMDFLRQGDWSRWQDALAETDFAAPWHTFLETYGHRGVYEVDVANPRWREEPGYLFDVLAAYAALDQDEAPFDPQTQAHHRQRVEQETLRQLPWWIRGWFRTILRQTQAFSRLREQSKSHLVMLIDLARQMALRAGDLLVEDGVIDSRDLIFFFERDEVAAALRGDIRPQTMRQHIARRQLERQRYAVLQPPEAIIGEQPIYDTVPLDPSATLSGLPSSPGRVTGTARVLRSPTDSHRLQAGDILIAPSTDPGWTPLFLLASGLVMETGGYLSHGAIVAREYGIPAVINVPGATHRIPDGETITLDGAAGTVQLPDPMSRMTTRSE